MKISTKGRYALRMMMDIAENQEKGYVALKDIALRQEISKKYLEQIALHLSQCGMLRAVRGYQGGYMLARAPKDYTAYEILRLTEGSLAPVACLGPEAEECPRMASCRTLPMWKKLDDMIRDFFQGVTLADLMNSVEPGNDYVI